MRQYKAFPGGEIRSQWSGENATKVADGVGGHRNSAAEAT